MNTVFIYALKCPESGNVRYVGKAIDPLKRLSQHLIECRRRNTHHARWLRLLITCSQRPILEVLDEVPESEWQQWEVAFIEYFREQGFDLTNSTAGGEGVHNPSREARAKISAYAKTRVFSSETRARMSASGKGKKKSLEHCNKIGDAQRGRVEGPHSPEHNAKIGASNLGKIRSEESRARYSHAARNRSEETHAKLSAAMMGNKRNLGKHHSLETRAKMSASGKGKERSPEHCAKISASLTGVKQSPETIAKRVAANRGKVRSEECRARFRAAQQLYQARKAAAKLAAQSLPPPSPDNPS